MEVALAVVLAVSSACIWAAFVTGYLAGVAHQRQHDSARVSAMFLTCRNVIERYNRAEKRRGEPCRN